MAVLVEAISVIVRKDAIVAKYVGGFDTFRANVPNNTFCDDGRVVRVGFMSPDDVQAYVERLQRSGLTYLAGGSAVDLTVVDQQKGMMVRCDWASCFQVPLFSEDGPKVVICAFEGKLDGSVELPDDWTYEGSLYASFLFVPSGSEETIRMETRRDNLETWRSRLSEKPVFVGRTGHNCDIGS